MSKAARVSIKNPDKRWGVLRFVGTELLAEGILTPEGGLDLRSPRGRFDRARTLIWVLLCVLGFQPGCHAAGPTSDEGQLCARLPTTVAAPAPPPTLSKDPLLRAVFETRDHGKLEAALAAAGDPNAQRGTTGITALAAAAAAGNLEAMRQLVSAGARLDARSRSGDTAVESAIMAVQAASTCWLLGHGAELQVGHKPYLLPAAALSDDFQAATVLVRLLLGRGCSADARIHGDTALHIAAELGNTALVETLLRHGASASLENTHGETPLAIAIRSSKQAAVATLLTAVKPQHPHLP